MQQNLISQVEIPEKSYRDFLEFVEDRYGLKLEWYNKSSVMRRLLKVMNQMRVNDLYTLKLLISESSHFQKFLDRFTVQVTELFREPKTWLEMRKSVLPVLKQRDTISILLVGSSTGEELSSLAIILDEMELMDKCQILATDLSAAALEKAHRPSISKARLHEADMNYRKAGGLALLEDYYQTTSSLCHFHEHLFRKVKFEQFDISSGELNQKFDLILCRNLLIYFQTEFQEHPLSQLVHHLKPGGFLSLGEQETMAFYPNHENLQIVSSSQKIYRQNFVEQV
tara:strand:+ start:399 stop:1247 length:849 start_codon:yes stop_codon:yes gene_type:complete